MFTLVSEPHHYSSRHVYTFDGLVQVDNYLLVGLFVRLLILTLSTVDVVMFGSR